MRHSTRINQSVIKNYLVAMNSYERKVYERGELVKEYVSTLDEPFALTGVYEIPTNWPVFWASLDEVCETEATADNSTPLESRYMTVSDVIKEAIKQYKKSDYYKNAKKAIDDARAALAAEEERLRQDIPAITARYDTLEKEHIEMVDTVDDYKRHLRDIKGQMASLEERVAESNLPKWLKEETRAVRDCALMSYNRPSGSSRGHWTWPETPLRLSGFSQAQIADGTAKREIHEQTVRIVNHGF